MPRIGVQCDVTGELLSDEECLACAHRWGKRQPPGGGAPRHCNYNYPFINAWLHPYDRSKAGISTTNVTSHCTRKTWYEGVIDYYQSPSKSHASVSGTAYHDFMDNHTEPEAIKEVRLVKRWRFQGKRREITGQMDYYRPDLALLIDYKEKKEDGVFRIAPDDYTVQMNIYRWMIETGCAILESGEVVQGSVNEMYLAPKSHMGQLMVPVPIWELWQVETFVNAVYTHLERARETGELPPRGFDSARSGFCKGWCPFQQQCVAAGGPIEQPPYHLGNVNLEEIEL